MMSNLEIIFSKHVLKLQSLPIRSPYDVTGRICLLTKHCNEFEGSHIDSTKIHKPVLRVVLPQHHVVGAGGGHEDDGGHIVETLDPLSALISLTTDIKHVELDLVNPELGLKDARGQDTCSQDVLLCWRESLLPHHVHLVQKVFGTVNQMVLVGAFKALLYTWVFPKCLCVVIKLFCVCEIRVAMLFQQPLSLFNVFWC